jgi:hypothetical protein
MQGRHGVTPDRDLKVYLAYNRAAELGLPAPTCDELCELLDEGDGGPVVATTVNITRRLEKRGLIKVRRYQRYREVQIVATGKWTADARCRTPHWRETVQVSTTTD